MLIAHAPNLSLNRQLYCCVKLFTYSYTVQLYIFIKNKNNLDCFKLNLLTKLNLQNINSGEQCILPGTHKANPLGVNTRIVGQKSKSSLANGSKIGSAFK